MSITVETSEGIVEDTQEIKESAASEEIADKGEDQSESNDENETEESDPQESTEESEDDAESDSDESEDESESDDESESEDDESKDELEEKPKRKSGFKKRIDKLNKRVSDRDSEIDSLRRQLATKDIPKQREENPAEPNPIPDSEAPNMDDFDEYSDYVNALTDHKVKIALAADKVEQVKQREQTAFTKQVSDFQAKVKDFSAKVEDFDELVHDLDDVPTSPGLQKAIIESDMAPEIMYELAKNPDEYKRVNQLTDSGIQRALGRIEAKLELSKKSSPKPVVKKKSKAPNPLEKIGTKGKGTAKSINDPNLSQKEWEKLRNEQLRNKA